MQVQTLKARKYSTAKKLINLHRNHIYEDDEDDDDDDDLITV